MNESGIFICILHIYMVQTRETGAREASWLKFALSKCDVDQHGLERDRMHDRIKYNAAVDSISQQKELIRHLSRYIEAERHVNRDVMKQNMVLLREAEHMTRVIQKKSSQLKKGKNMLQNLMKEIDIKNDVIRSTQNQLLLAQSRYDEKVMESKQAPAADMSIIESLMAEHGLTKEKVVSYVKEYIGMDHKDILAQGNKVASLEKKVSTLQNSCKEQEKKRKQAEKTVKSQKKELEAKEKRIKTLEDSLKAHEGMTPAAPRAVTRAMEAVGNIMAELGGVTPSTDGKHTARKEVERRGESGGMISPSESTGRGSVSTKKRTQHAKYETVEPSNEADVSIWNPDSDKENPTKMLSFASDGIKPASMMIGGAAPGSKRKLLSVSSHNRKQPLMGVTKKNTGFTIPKLNNNNN